MVTPDPITGKRASRLYVRRPRESYNGFTAAAIEKILTKPSHLWTLVEKRGVEVYFEERLSNMGCSIHRGTPGELKYEYETGGLLQAAEAEYVSLGGGHRTKAKRQSDHAFPECKLNLYMAALATLDHPGKDRKPLKDRKRRKRERYADEMPDELPYGMEDELA